MKGDIKNRIPEPMIVALDDGLEVNDELISYCLRETMRNTDRYRRLKNYYKNRTSIQERVISDSDKPNNRISHAFARYITKIATAYFMGKGIRYETKNRRYKKELDDIFDSNHAAMRNFEESKEASKCGISYELLYIDPNGKLRTQQFDAEEIIPVFSASPGEFLTMALRPYQIKRIQRRASPDHFVDVYTKDEVITFHSRGSRWAQIERRPHHFSDVPVIVRMNNAEQRGDYEDVIPQIDAYDRAQSDTANDLDYFADAYLTMEGAAGLEAEDENGNAMSHSDAVSVMRRERILFPPEGGKIYFVTKDTSDGTAEHYKQRIYKDIFFISQVANLTDEAFAGNLSGVAIKYKLFGLEELSIEKETYFISSERKKLRLVTEYINTLRGTRYDWRDVNISFDRSSVANDMETAEIMQMLSGVLSDETIVGMWPRIKDVAEELKRKLKEQAERENTGLPDDEGVM